jgi:hypothetical protein
MQERIAFTSAVEIREKIVQVGAIHTLLSVLFSL